MFFGRGAERVAVDDHRRAAIRPRDTSSTAAASNMGDVRFMGGTVD
jgi:hypothetical protein